MHKYYVKYKECRRLFGNLDNRAVNYRYNGELQHESSDKLEFIWIPTSVSSYRR